MAENNKDTVKVHAASAGPQVSDDAVAPMVDVYLGDDGAMTLVAEVPGASPEGVDVRVDKGVLTVIANAKPRKLDEKYARTYVGFVADQYVRAFAIGDEFDRERIEASLADGVLTIKLPRAVAAQSRKIPVRTE